MKRILTTTGLFLGACFLLSAQETGNNRLVIERKMVERAFLAGSRHNGGLEFAESRFRPLHSVSPNCPSRRQPGGTSTIDRKRPCTPYPL